MKSGPIVLLGAGGQLGSEWRDFLISRKIPFSGFTSAEADIANTAALEGVLRAIKPVLVLNCAAYTKVDRAESETERAFAINAEAVKNLARLAEELDFLLVHFSTDYVFPGTAAHAASFPNGYPEESETAPANVYGASKLRGEQYLRESNAQFLLIRVAWLCGKHGNNFVKTMLRLGREKDRLRVVADQVGAPSFCENVVFNTWQLIANGCTGVYHLASTDACTWHELAAEALRWSGIQTPVDPISTADFPTPAKRPAFSRLDVSKSAGENGVVLTGWKQGLHNLLHEIS